MPILDPDTIEFISRSPEQTQRVGARLGMFLQSGDVVAMTGGLGSGKTLLAQGIGRGWGTTAALLSPTFVLVRRHTRPQDSLYLYHIDLYRLESVPEIESLGLEEMLGAPDSVCLVEWADRAPDSLPDEVLWVDLRWLDEFRRSLTFHASGSRHCELLATLRKEIMGR
ncbi:MAG: tRNA (adenosine(37)-N6)-threonylcarbamoyltransferase complex ATPase subunit type 1 TsaE [Anaerolineae bacterium]|nr:tRNA (adenosine(37)-N6)-threonylcarbamoyltransferase complex ATPase subunit type 1 TsaE [Anaerolineae bacterium]